MRPLTDNEQRVINAADRYLKINRWLRDRYRDPETGMVVLQTGPNLSTYSRLDLAFWGRYMRQHCS